MVNKYRTFIKFGMSFLRYASSQSDRQTDRQTDSIITIVVKSHNRERINVKERSHHLSQLISFRVN